MNSLGFHELMELFEYKTIKSQEKVNKAKKVGEITEWFKNPKAGVAIIENVNLSIEDNVILLSETYCQPATIKSLKDEEEKQVEKIEAIQEREVGLKFDVDARKGLFLYIIK